MLKATKKLIIGKIYQIQKLIKFRSSENSYWIENYQIFLIDKNNIDLKEKCKVLLNAFYLCSKAATMKPWEARSKHTVEYVVRIPPRPWENTMTGNWLQIS